MKRNYIILGSSVLLFVLTLIQIIRISKPTNLSTDIPPSVKEGMNKKTVDLKAFPVNEEVIVSLSLNYLTGQGQEEEEIKEQVRDWLLFTLISNLGLNNRHLNKVMHNVANVRDQVNKKLYKLSYGPTRSKQVTNSLFLALIPRSPSQEWRDHLAYIADLERKNSGKIPDSILVFEYDIHQNLEEVSIRRKKTFAGAKLFSEEFGYTEITLNNSNQLKTFLEKTQTLSFVKRVGEKDLLLGGRTLKSRSNQNIGIEEVAVIWNSKRPVFNSPNNQYGHEFRFKLGYNFDGIIKALNRKMVEIGYSFGPVINYLRNRNIDAAYKWIQNESDYNSELALQLQQVVKEILDKNIYYIPQYDKHLKGTEVGMTLFYTDLIAKIWLYGNHELPTTPENFRKVSTGREQISQIHGSPANDLLFSEIWMGASEKRFNKSGDIRDLFFEWNAVDIFSHTYNPLDTAVSIVPFHIDKRTQWLEEHMEQLLSYDPQFSKLNEIIKWNILFSWLIDLNEPRAKKVFSFLNDFPYENSLSFPTWMRSQNGLVFSEWVDISISSSLCKENNTECFSLDGIRPDRNSGNRSSSYVFGRIFLETPVLAWRRKGFKGGGGGCTSRPSSYPTPRIPSSKPKPDVPQAVAPKQDISTTNALESPKVSNPDPSLKKEIEYEFLGPAHNPGYKITPSKKVRLGNQYSEIQAGKSFEFKLKSQKTRKAFESNIGETPIGELFVKPTGNGFSVGFQGKAFSKSNQLARALSKVPSSIKFLNAQKGKTIEEFVSLNSESHFLVKLKGNDKWVEMDVASKAEVNMDPKWDTRVASHEKDSKVVRQKWLSKEEASSLAGKYSKEIPKSSQPQDLGQEAIWKNYSEGQHDQIAQKVLLNPDGLSYRRKVAEMTKNKVKHLDEIFQTTKDYQYCRDEIDKLIRTVGEKPELLFRRGLIDLKIKGKAHKKAGIYELNQSIREAGRNNRDLADELSYLMKNDGNFTQREISEVNRFSAYHSGKKNHIVAEIKPPENIENVDASKVEKMLDENKAKIIIHDDPRLNNMDWNVSSSQALKQVLDVYPDAILTKVPRRSLRDYQFDSIKLDYTYSSKGMKIRIKPSSIIRASRHLLAKEEDCDESDPDKICKTEYMLILPEAS